PGRLERRRMTVTAVDELHARRAREQFDGLGLRHRTRETEVRGYRVADVHGHAYTRDGDEQVVGVEDLAALMEHLPLFRGEALLPERSGEWDDVAGDGAGPHLARGDVAVDGAGAPEHVSTPVTFRPLLVELAQSGLSRARHRLVRRDHHALELSGAMERGDRGQRHRGRAVRARRDPLRHALEVAGIDLC